MAEKKITKRERFEFAKSVVLAHPELFTEIPNMAEFIDHEIELLDRKTSKSTSANPDTVAVAEIVRDILAECADPKGMTVGSILKDERIKSYTKQDGNPVSSQMLTTILSRDKSSFINTKEKKISYYALNYGVEETEGV